MEREVSPKQQQWDGGGGWGWLCGRKGEADKHLPHAGSEASGRPELGKQRRVNSEHVWNFEIALDETGVM